jgi:hypothetical protein
MTESELKDLEECSEMFDFTGFTLDEDKRLLAEVRRLQQELERISTTGKLVRKAWHHTPFNLRNMSMAIVALGACIEDISPKEQE